MSWLDNGRHRALTTWKPRICPVGVNPVSFEFGTLSVGRIHHDSSRCVHFFGHQIAFLYRVAEQLLQHQNHVFVSVIIVVKKDNIPRGKGLPFAGDLLALEG